MKDTRSGVEVGGSEGGTLKCEGTKRGELTLLEVGKGGLEK